MKTAINTSIIRFILMGLIVAFAAGLASAQHGYRITKRVKFKKGEVAATVSGAIPNTLEVHEYLIRAREGQTIMVKLHTARASLGFYIMSPSDAMVEEETFLKHYTGTLNESGDYRILVYTTKGGGKYRMEIQIATDI